MAPTELITDRLTQANWRSVGQAMALVLGLFAFLPMTRVVTESRKAPVEITQIRPSQEASSKTINTQTQRQTPPSSVPDSPKLNPLPIPALQSVATSLPNIPMALTASAPPMDDSFDFPMESVAPELTPQAVRLDQAPQLIYQPEVIYPHALQRKRISGTVTIRFAVDETGRVREVEVEEAPKNDAFEKAAIRAIRRGKWKPGERNGRPVKAWVRRTIDFQP
jgi:protein TonB